MPINDGIRYDIGADNTEFTRAVDEARKHNAKAAEAMAKDYEKMAERSQSALAQLFVQFTPQGRIAAAFRAVAGGIQQARAQFDQLMARGDTISGRLGGSLQESFGELKTATAELGTSFVTVAGAAIQAVGENTGITASLAGVTEAATRATRAVQDYVESWLPLANRSTSVIEREIARLTEQIDAMRGRGVQGGGFRFPLTPEADAENELHLLEEQRRIRQEMLEDRNANTTAIEQQIEAMKRRTTELRIQAETFGLAAGAAARLAAQIRAIESAGGEGPFGRLSYDLRRRLTEAMEALEEQRQRVQDLEREKRQREQRERIGTSMEQEVARLQGQLRRAGMPAGEAAEETFIERSRLRFQQARITPTDEDNAKIAEAAKRVRELTEATNALKRSMDIIQSFAQTFSSSLERAFTSWIDGAWKGWRDFFHNLSTQLATLALRTAILQPLFGGGGIQQGGIFGQFLASLIPRAGGGDVQSGQPYMVGERGRELFIPSQSGTIVPNHALGRGGGATINMRIDLAGANGDAAIMRMVQIGAAAAAKQAVMATQAGMPGWQRSARMLGA